MPFLIAVFPFLFTALVAFFAIPPIVFGTYWAGSAILLVGLILAFRRDILRAHGLEKIVRL